jgi:ADP-ribose pyrophosphatase YjhB (NUDIX family)
MENIGPREPIIPEGDDRERLGCPDCGYIAYENPKIIVGVVATWGDRYLMCRRAINPRKGYWTLPAGFMELGETAPEGAAREAREEACATLSIDKLLCLYDLPHISQIQLLYRAQLTKPDIDCGPESQEVALFHWHEIPWDDLAFPTVSWALHHHRQAADQTDFAPFGNPVGASARMTDRD